MSWTKITTTGKYQPIPSRCWVAGYQEGVWEQTQAQWKSGGWYHLFPPLEDIPVDHHPITHFAPFEAPEPPPKLPTLLEAAQAFCRDAPHCYHRESSVYHDLIDAKEREEVKRG